MTPRLLPNGDILLSGTDRDGRPATHRVEVGSDLHARWLAHLDRKKAPRAERPGVGTVVVSALIPLAGMICAIVYLARGRAAAAGACLLAALLGVFAYSLVLGAAGV